MPIFSAWVWTCGFVAGNHWTVSSKPFCPSATLKSLIGRSGTILSTNRTPSRSAYLVLGSPTCHLLSTYSIAKVAAGLVADWMPKVVSLASGSSCRITRNKPCTIALFGLATWDVCPPSVTERSGLPMPTSLLSACQCSSNICVSTDLETSSTLRSIDSATVFKEEERCSTSAVLIGHSDAFEVGRTERPSAGMFASNRVTVKCHRSSVSPVALECRNSGLLPSLVATARKTSKLTGLRWFSVGLTSNGVELTERSRERWLGYLGSHTI